MSPRKHRGVSIWIWGTVLNQLSSFRLLLSHLCTLMKYKQKIWRYLCQSLCPSRCSHSRRQELYVDRSLRRNFSILKKYIFDVWIDVTDKCRSKSISKYLIQRSVECMLLVNSLIKPFAKLTILEYLIRNWLLYEIT